MGLKQIKERISATESVVKVTKVVQLISANKFRGAKEIALASESFYNANLQNITEIIKLFESLSRSECDQLSFMAKKIKILIENSEEVGNKEMVVFVNSDKSLCGNLNTSVAKEFAKYVREKLAKNSNATFAVYYLGKQSKVSIKNYLKENISRVKLISLDGFYDEKMDANKLSDLVATVMKAMETEEVNDISVFFSRFASVVAQYPQRISLIDTVKKVLSSQEDQFQDYIIDVEKPILINHAIDLYVNSFFTKILRQHIASEHALRMTSMDNATKNGMNLQDKLLLQYNKGRQAKITSELIEYDFERASRLLCLMLK